jgi:hypothetical protein
MKVVVHCILFATLTLAGCRTPSDPRGAAAAGPASSVQFHRSARVYEDGDALFAIMNHSTRVLWFEGKGPEEPSYRLKVGQTIGQVQNRPVMAADGTPERFPLAPGHSCYFHINAADLVQPASVGVMFYPGRTTTNGFMMWSPAVPIPTKQR